MKSPMISQLDSALKNQDLTLGLEIPLPGASDSCSSSPKISLGLGSIQLEISKKEQPISGTFTKEQIEAQDLETGNLP